MPYWVPAGAAAAAMGLLLIFGRFVPFRLRPVQGRRAVLMLTVAFALVYMWLGFWKNAACQYGMMDFGIYDSMLRIAASGQGILRDYRGGAFDHFSPAVLLFVPLYRLHDGPGWLIVIQAVGLALAAPFAYLLAMRVLKDPLAALAMAAATLLNPYVSRLALYDFHIEALFPALFLAAFWARAAGRKRLSWGLLASAIFLKEDFAIPVAAVGLWLLLFQKGERRAGALLLGWTAAWVALILCVYFPLMSETGYWHYGRYDLAGENAAEVLTKLGAMAARVFGSPESLPLALSVLLPFAFLPLADWRFCLIVALPTLAVQLASAAWHQHLLASHYASALIGVMPAAALFGWRKLRLGWRHHRRWRRALPVAVLGGALLTHLLFCELPLARYHADIPTWNPMLHGGFFSIPFRPLYWTEMGNQERAAQAWRAVADQLPAGATVAAQNELGPSLLRRGAFQQLPGDFTADFYCFDRALYSGYDGEERINETLTRLLTHPGYRLVYRDRDIVIFQKEPHHE